MSRPRLFQSSDYESLSTLVERGYYHVYKDKGNLPQAIKRVGGYPSSDNYEGTLIMASTTGGNPPTIGGVVPASSSPIYRVTVMRSDCHSDGIYHANEDDVLIFADTHGNTCQKTATDKSSGSGHFIQLAKDSGLDIALDVYQLPDKDHGKLSDLKGSKIQPNFSTCHGTSGTTNNS